MVKLINDVSAIFLLAVIIYKLIKQKYHIVNNLCFWFVFFYFCYISFSCIFIEEINDNWGFSDRSIMLTRMLVTFYNLIFGFAYAFLGKCNYIEDKISITPRIKLTYQLAVLAEIMGTFLFLLAILEMLRFRQGKSFAHYEKIRNYGVFLEGKYHVRTFLYILISSSFYLYYKDKKLIWFIPLFLVVMFETLCNARTTAFVVLLYLYTIYVMNRKRLELKIMIPICMGLLIGVLFVRNAFLSGGKGTKIPLNMIFGEFFETFTTLPYIIDNDLLGNGFKLDRILCDYTFGFFIPGGLRTKIFSNYVSVGGELAHVIGRGYGLGNNFISESLFEFNVGAILIVPMYFFLFYLIDRRINNSQMLIFKVIFIFQLRLFIREGIPQLMLSLYIILIYVCFFYFTSINNKILILKSGLKYDREKKF